ncbi:5-(carboxyamino)imidazole ribonucleotide synthase [Paenisporosarcina cavernae]|uniref:N5-carboxyaminoimidazole ribonucleotide synthase n=1 Tax=Paenisporosarcina cavernae TaxID=2320858 RepID=A0A385YUF6_9BACL|nr:5-(carboxyamino)imidazole ribonucleotide synthase [Paenisporosarcina cavernae]AYC30316.1 5-(carboxyamino)imidazole ribonucleotide synthase [Paenisporosarcina cavernae]
MMRTILPGQTIGIIGGGQLGRMMALAAKEAGFKIAVLDPTLDSPCGQVADIQIVANFDDQDALEELAECSDVITYEFENIDYESLKQLCNIAYIPQGAELIRVTQNRLIEKQTIEAAGVEVAAYREVTNEEELTAATEALGFPCILKTTFGGYDGKGQMTLSSTEDFQKVAELYQTQTCVLEKFVPFEKEISVIVQRNAKGETRCLPVAENIHVDHILHESIVPARTPEYVQLNAMELATKIADSVSLIGTLAVEMFVLEDGEILVNELAPRPHNSGHYSIEATRVSQFEQHIRAICGWPLATPELLKPCVMVNVLGEHVVPLTQILLKYPDWSIHLYGKKEAKHKRKMGHVTILTDNIDITLDEIEHSGVWSN